MKCNLNEKFRLYLIPFCSIFYWLKVFSVLMLIIAFLQKLKRTIKFWLFFLFFDYNSNTYAPTDNPQLESTDVIHYKIRRSTKT